MKRELFKAPSGIQPGLRNFRMRDRISILKTISSLLENGIDCGFSGRSGGTGIGLQLFHLNPAYSKLIDDATVHQFDKVDNPRILFGTLRNDVIQFVYQLTSSL